MSRPSQLRTCHGFNRKTGKTVGSRHRWGGGYFGGWGKGYCDWCGRNVEQLRVFDKKLA